MSEPVVQPKRRSRRWLYRLVGAAIGLTLGWIAAAKLFG
jgi:hypothetical protein